LQFIWKIISIKITTRNLDEKQNENDKNAGFLILLKLFYVAAQKTKNNF
jgi:hypothetical protein